MNFSFFPKTIYKTKTKISGGIMVKEQFGNYTLLVQNLTQSGGIIKNIWQKPLKKINKANHVLILGLGGGTVVQLIKKRFPQAKITGLEIDKEIIKIGKKYFGLNEVRDLRVINNDAVEWVKNYQGDKFDLILVDLYLGGEFPQKAFNDEFFKSLKKILSQKGIVILNWLKNKDEKEIKEKFNISFPEGECLDLKTNLFLIHRHQTGDTN